MNILILKVQTIGDTLLISPLIANLRQYYVDAKIDVMVNEGTQPMLAFNPNVNRILEYKRESYRGLTNWQRFVKNIKLLKDIRRERYDLVIDLDEGDRGALISWISGGKTKIGSASISSRILKLAYTHFLPIRGQRHSVEINLDPLKLLETPVIKKHVELFWSQEDENIAQKKLENIDNFIHIHPFSKGWFKDIDIQSVAKIIDFCEQELDIKVVLTAAPNSRELDKLDEILNLCNSQPLNLGGKLSLTQIGALNQHAKLFIGVDTAIMHISASNNVPILAFFGPTAPDNWGPWDNQMECADYHRKGGLQINGKHRVLSDQRSCMPCNKEGCNNSQISDCLINLNMPIIQQNIKEMLEQ